MKRLVLKSIAAAVAVAAFGMAAAQDIKERTLKFGVAGPETHPAAAGMKKFAEAVTAKSGGKIKVNLFFNSSLGTDQAIVSALKGGTVEMSVMNSGILASEAKELALFDFPFLFANEKESDAIVDGAVGKKMHALLQEKGLVGLSYWELGYRHMTNSKRSITSAADAGGLKMRTMENPVHIAAYKGLGIITTPMAFPEVFTALQQGTVDGQENPLPVIMSTCASILVWQRSIRRHAR